jgi:enamine deaminase RidA (YjgF/YER057c/UK114 family)
MAGHRRINVASGRPLEKLAHYSRAVRVGDMVLQSGTTAIDRQGNVRGVGDVAAQVDAIMAIARWSMGKAGGRLEDVVRSRIYVTDIAVAVAAARAVAKYFRDVRPAATLVQVNRLARPEQLVEIELDAVDGARDTARRISSGRAIEEEFAYSRAVRVGNRIFISGSTALGRRRPGGRGGRPLPADAEHDGHDPRGAVGSRRRARRHRLQQDVRDRCRGRRGLHAGWLDALGEVRPTSTLLGIPALLRPDMLIEIETEAIVGAAAARQDIYLQEQRERSRGYARAVAVGDAVYVSGCTALSLSGKVEAEGDWAAQSDLSHQAIERALAQAGATLDDVVRRRSFTVDGAEVNRPYGQGPAWFAKSCPSSLGCRIAGLARPELLVEVEVAAVKGARAGIEWIGPDEVDPLDAATAR